MINTEQFGTLLAQVRSRYPDVIAAETAIAAISEEYDAGTAKFETVIYTNVTCVALLFIVSAPIILGWGIPATHDWAVTQVSSWPNKAALTADVGLLVSLAGACMAAMCYGFIMHLSQFRIAALRLRLTKRYDGDIDRTMMGFVLFVYLMGSIFVTSGAVLLNAFVAFATPAVPWLLTIVLSPPLLVASLLPAVGLLVLLMTVFDRYDPAYYAPQGSIVQALLTCLVEADRFSSPADLTFSARQRLRRHIRKASYLISDLYKTTGRTDSSTAWAAGQMRLIGDNLLVLNSWLALPRDATIRNVKERLVVYTNAFLAGTYDILPTTDLGPVEGLFHVRRDVSLWRTIGGLGALFLLIAAPPALIVTLGDSTHAASLSAVQAPLTIVYGAWTAMCLLIYMTSVAPDVKNHLIEVVRVVLVETSIGP